MLHGLLIDVKTKPNTKLFRNFSFPCILNVCQINNLHANRNRHATHRTIHFSIFRSPYETDNAANSIPHFWLATLEIATLTHKFSSVTLYKNKTVRYAARMHAIIACQMEFQLYPMDIQICPIYIESCKFFLPGLWGHSRKPLWSLIMKRDSIYVVLQFPIAIRRCD